MTSGLVFERSEIAGAESAHFEGSVILVEGGLLGHGGAVRHIKMLLWGLNLVMA